MKWSYQGVFFSPCVYARERACWEFDMPTTEFKGLRTCSNWSNIRWKRSTKNILYNFSYEGM